MQCWRLSCRSNKQRSCGAKLSHELVISLLSGTNNCHIIGLVQQESSFNVTSITSFSSTELLTVQHQHQCKMPEQWRRNRNMIGGLVWEAAKLPIIHAKRLHAKVKNWGGGAKAPGSATLVPETPDSLPFSWLRETKTNTLGVYEQWSVYDRPMDEMLKESTNYCKRQALAGRHDTPINTSILIGIGTRLPVGSNSSFLGSFAGIL